MCADVFNMRQDNINKCFGVAIGKVWVLKKAKGALGWDLKKAVSKYL